MSVASIFAAILGLIKAIPVIDGWVQQFIAFYVTTRITQMNAEQRAALKKAVIEHDQIDLEKAIGNPNAGLPSGIPGVVVRPDLPGVHQTK